MRNLFKLKNHESQRGVAAVEFAIILPLLVILLAGIIEFGLLLYNQQMITNAAREGARASIRPIPLLGTDDVENVVEQYCEDKMITFGNISEDLKTIFVSPLEANFENRIAGDDVTIKVTFEYSFVIPGIIGLGPTYVIESFATMRMM